MKNIEPTKRYTPREIVKNGWIRSTGDSEDGHYNFVLREIRAGKLKSINYSHGQKEMPYYAVMGSEILRYKKEVEGIDM